MKLFKILTNRIFLSVFLILAQFAWFTLILTRLAARFWWLNLVFAFIGILIALFLVSKDESPGYKLGWMMVILSLPIVGGPLYLIVGNKRPSHKLSREINACVRASEIHRNQNPEVLRDVPPRIQGLLSYVSNSGGFPAWDETETTYYPLGEPFFEAICEALEAAEHFIFLEYFIIARGHMWDTILEILKRKAASGVDVRVIYDDMGCLRTLPEHYDKQLEAMGIRSLIFNPFKPFVSLVINNRDHRKILVIDGHTAFNGGINIGDEYINRKERFGHWKDTGIRLVGKGVWNFTVMFLDMWNAFRKTDSNYMLFAPPAQTPSGAMGIVQPFSDSPWDDEVVSENIYIDILSQATDYVYIFTPYLIIDSDMHTALCAAAKRGVDVRIATPGIPDKPTVYSVTRSFYPSLIKAGVRIFEYTPGFLHAKSYISDDRLAVVGTINMDYRSLYLHFECGTLLYNCSCLRALKRDCLEVFEKSREVHEYALPSSFFQRLWHAILRVFAPLM